MDSNLVAELNKLSLDLDSRLLVEINTLSCDSILEIPETDRVFELKDLYFSNWTADRFEPTRDIICILYAKYEHLIPATLDSPSNSFSLNSKYSCLVVAYKICYTLLCLGVDLQHVLNFPTLDYNYYLKSKTNCKSNKCKHVNLCFNTRDNDVSIFNLETSSIEPIEFWSNGLDNCHIEGIVLAFLMYRIPDKMKKILEMPFYSD
jgi:hypothetical protein